MQVVQVTQHLSLCLRDGVQGNFGVGKINESAWRGIVFFLCLESAMCDE